MRVERIAESTDFEITQPVPLETVYTTDNSTYSETVTGDEPSTTTYANESGLIPVEAEETAPSNAVVPASLDDFGIGWGVPSFSIAFTPDTDEMGGGIWENGYIGLDDGVEGSAQQDPGATLIALAAWPQPDRHHDPGAGGQRRLERRR